MSQLSETSSEASAPYENRYFRYLSGQPKRIGIRESGSHVRIK